MIGNKQPSDVKLELQQLERNCGHRQEFEHLNHDDIAGDSPKKVHPKTVSFLALFKFATGLDYILITVGSIGAVAHGGSLPLAVLFFGKLVDSIGTYFLYPAKLYGDAKQDSLVFVYVGLVILFSSWIEVSCWTFTAERQTTRMRSNYLRALLSQDVGFYDTESSTGEVIVGFSNDTILVQESIGEKVGNFIHHMATFIGAFSVSFSISWQLTLLTLAAVPLVALSGLVFAFTIVSLASSSQKAYVVAGEIVEQAIAQIRTVYAFGGEGNTITSYMKALQITARLGKKGGLAKGLGIGSVIGLQCLSWALLLWFSGRMVQHGNIRGGLAFVTILNAVIGGMAIGQACPSLAVFVKGKAAGYTILEMIKREPYTIHYQQGEILQHVKGHIEFENVHFCYPSRTQTVVFQDLSLTIPAGKLVAIVGGSGSGKSTIVSLIERFYDPNSGQVLLDGHNIRNLQLKWLRSQIGLVNQEPALFATTIRENISFGKDDATVDEVVKAAELSNAHVFISEFPAKYETQVGERGAQLSGGQKQRIAIARAMIRDPAILLLDEATSALDSESEKSVQDALGQVMVGRTSVVVAHRLSTIRNADIIAVLHQGRVVEVGVHEELIQKEGTYAALVKQHAASSKTPEKDTKTQRHSRGSSLTERAFSFHSSASLTDRVFSFHRTGSVVSDTASQLVEDVQAERKDFGRSSIKKMIKLNSPDWPYGILGTIGAIVAGGSVPLIVFGVTHVLVAFYSIEPGYMTKEIHKTALIFCGATLPIVMFFAIEHYAFTVMGENATLRVRASMLSAILRNEIGWFEDDCNNAAMIASRLSSDALHVKAAVADLLCTLTHNVSLVVMAVVLALLQQWRTTLVMVATFPLTVSAAWAQRQALKGFGGDLSESYLRANRVAGEAVGNIRTVAAFCGEDKVLKLFQMELERPTKETFWRGQVAGLCFGLSQCCLFCSIALILWYGAKLIHDGVIGFGPMLKSFTVLLITAFSFAETLLLAPNVIEGLRRVGSVFTILERRTKIDPDDPEAEEVEEVKGTIELRHVRFGYPTRLDVKVFEDLNLKVLAGRSVALVGASGSGKSTIIALVARFYDPISGEVMVDGNNVKGMRLRSLRRQMGLVQQEPALFASTIYENICYGSEGATEAEVIAAARAADAHGFISGLAEGYQTSVGERGVQLSGGQRQRVALARVVLRNPSILLLDEPTSALDAHSERLVQAALDKVMAGRTTLVVAHRLSTVRHLHTIIVLAGGKIVETGTHAELVHRNGAYVRLLNLQQT